MSYLNLVRHKYTAGQISSYTGAHVDDGHPDGTSQFLHVSHDQDLEPQCYHKVEQPV